MKHEILKITGKRGLSKGDVIQISNLILRVRTIRQKGNIITVFLIRKSD